MFFLISHHNLHIILSFIVVQFPLLFTRTGHCHGVNNALIVYNNQASFFLTIFPVIIIFRPDLSLVQITITPLNTMELHQLMPAENLTFEMYCNIIFAFSIGFALLAELGMENTENNYVTLPTVRDKCQGWCPLHAILIMS